VSASDTPFLKLLRDGIERGGFGTDDVLAIALPLLRQAATTHLEGLVAPLEGIRKLHVTDHGSLAFDIAKASSPRSNASRIEQLQQSASRAVEVVGHSRRTMDVDEGRYQIDNLGVSDGSQEITRPVFLTGYRSWEHAVGHHDEITDIFCLGLILASFACDLDFTDQSDLEMFVNNRENLFGVNRRLNPVLGAVIVQMTELNRHRRAQELGAIIRRLENYREQPVDFDTTFQRIEGFKESPTAGKRKIIQTHMRDRLFEISRRNRLIYFKPTLQTLNLTIASVPLLLDYRNIQLEQLFVWHAQLAETVIQGAPMSLGKYLRFEDAPYIPGVLDKIISEARRDRAEYGFAQLRLVLCFLRWNNLKEAPAERIHSPLLLLPVELTKKKGVRDSYVLDPTTSEAEVNPALRHHLKSLYNLDLPETVDLKEITLDAFHKTLQTQIQASEPGIVLNKIDRPQIELIHARARQRLDQYRRRQQLKGRALKREAAQDYNYSRENFHPRGLQLFLEKVRPQPLPLSDVAGAPPVPRLPHIVAAPGVESGKILETERQMFALRDGENQNPYSWDLDLCSITLGNFNYRKMTLVRDYNNLIEADQPNVCFDTIFSLAPKQPEEPAPLTGELSEQFLIVPCDATQSSAIGKVRSGRSYIIQGPPGTGKSQTITNLIADYVARDKRVLFVCEKRAAIDIVYHRLRQQGLDELCCLIHDSQTDKKEFIQNLKQTYEKFLGERQESDECQKTREAALRAIEQDLAQLKRFSDAMQQPHPSSGLRLRKLLHRLVELRALLPRSLTAELEEQLPDYCLWLDHGELVNRLQTALTDLGAEPCFANQTVRWLGKSAIEADRPLEAIRVALDKAEALLENVESALEFSGLSGELWDTLDEVQTLLAFATRVRPLAEKDLLALLDRQDAKMQRFAKACADFEEKQRAFTQAVEKTSAWKDRLSPDDTQSALAQARNFENSIFRFVQPAFWRLRKVLRARYDFSRHAVAPSWTKILEDLSREHQTRAALEQARGTACRDWGVDDLPAFQRLVADIHSAPDARHPSIRALTRNLVSSAEGRELVRNLAEIHERFAELDQTLSFLLAEHKHFDCPALSEVLASLREELSTLPELLPILSEVINLPESLARALRHVELSLPAFEPAMGHKSLNRIYREDRSLSRFEGRLLEQRLRRLETQYLDLLRLNAKCIRANVRKKFLEHVNLSSLSATQLDNAQKLFKKNYTAGRRDLEHEFGKTMRYKSIRDLAAGNSGQVIQDLKPIWLMSPLSVSDTLPLDTNLFDVVIFDEASQIPVEEAVPAVYRSNQVIVVGDEMQLPPTSFFSASRSEDEESVLIEEEGEQIKVDLDSDSFLTQAAVNLPSTLLAWHYRSRYEALISFSNAAFYSGQLFTIPDRQLPAPTASELRVSAPEQAVANTDATLERSISFHFLENGIYVDRRNPAEAEYIAHLVRSLLNRDTKLSLGIVAFSEAQQTEIENALERLASEDAEFGAKLEAEFIREESDQFCGLFVKNLENVQGDERDIIILSVCYGYDPSHRMLMNFGPINQRGGEKRLNVIFSRAKHHMAIISSIRYHDITNEYNDGANSLRNFLQYAEATSKGDLRTARQVLESLNPIARKSLAPETARDAVIDALADALRARGYTVDANVGQSRFRCDLAIRGDRENFYAMGILVDTDAHYANPNLLERYLTQPSILRAFGWRVRLVLTKDWLEDAEGVLTRLQRELRGDSVEEEPAAELEPIEPPKPAPAPAAPPPPPPLPVASATPSSTRRFEFIQGNSRKFWEITQDKDTITVHFGRLGTEGQTQTKAFASEQQAHREAQKLITEKTRKGYKEH
jgi:superfamily I DNA and/or RNA helicase/predicted DNA-binding WGR domain protein